MISTVTLNASLDKTYWSPGFSVNQTNRVNQVKLEPGGKGVNVAKVLSDLGEEVYVTGFIGGSNGLKLKEDLSKYKQVQQGWIEIKDDTRTCLNIIDKTSNTETEILEHGPHIEEKDKTNLFSKLEQIAKFSKIIVFSGSLPKGLDHQTYYQLITFLKNFDVKLAIDTSGDSLENSILAKPDIIKPNLSELEQYCGKKLNSFDEVVSEARKLYWSGIRYVFVSLGKMGAIAITKEGTIYSEVPSVEVYNTVGSGDATLAGIVAAIKNDEPIDVMLKSGMAAGIANALQPVAGRVEKKDYAYFFKKVNIKRLG